MTDRRVLLNPGPATTSEAVKRALVIPDVCPREAEFVELYADVRARLVALCGTADEAVAVPLPGNGTTALEALLGRVVGDGDRLLVVDNGDYGARLAAIAAALRLPHAVVACGWGQPVDLVDVERALEAARPAPGGAVHLAFVHHETSTGELNPLAALAALARGRGAFVLVDAMSSFGARPLRVGPGPGAVDAVVSSSNKCVQGMAGLGLVVAARPLLAHAAGVRPRSVALDLVAEARALEATGQSRFTVPPQVASALRAALVELECEGVAGRQARYERCHGRLLAGLGRLGFEPLLPEARQSRILLAVRAPVAPWFDFERLHDALLARGFTIYPGKPGHAPCFRLSVLGDLHEPDIDAFLGALGEWVARARGRPPC